MDIDDKIRRGIRIAGWVLFALCLSPFVVVVVVRNLPPTAERQAALDVLHQPTPPVRGRDGSDALLLSRYDVPPAQQAEVAAKVREYLVKHDALMVAKREAKADRLPDPRDKLTSFPKLEGEPAWLCPQNALGCLAAVRKDPAAAAAALQANAAGVDALARLSQFDGTRLKLQPTYTQEYPAWGPSYRLLATRHALDYIQGQQGEAVAALCRETAGWRRLGADTDMLISSMVAGAYARHNLALLSEMLAELPPGATLPGDCDAALAPVQAEELDLCPSIKAEFASSEHMFSHDMMAGSSEGGRTFVHLMIDTDHVVSVIAPSYAAYCGVPMHQAAAQDRMAATAHPPQPKCGFFEKVGDPIGCWMADLASAYGNYQDRRTDLAQQIALMRTVAWVHAHGTGTQSDFDRRPDSLGLRRRAEVSADGLEVSIPNYDQRRDKRFALQLKAAPAAD